MQFGSQRWPKVATGNRKLFATNIRTSWHSFSSFLGNGKLSGVAGVKSEHKWKLWPINGIIEFPLDFFFLALKIPPTSHTYIFFGFCFVAAKLDDDWPKGVQFYILGKWEMPPFPSIWVKSLLVKNGPSHRSSSGKSESLSLSWDKSDKWILHKSN